jgi:hypothetical protein
MIPRTALSPTDLARLPIRRGSSKNLTSWLIRICLQGRVYLYLKQNVRRGGATKSGEGTDVDPINRDLVEMHIAYCEVATSTRKRSSWWASVKSWTP